MAKLSRSKGSRLDRYRRGKHEPLDIAEIERHCKCLTKMDRNAIQLPCFADQTTACANEKLSKMRIDR